LQAQERLDEAIDHFQQAVRLDPNYAWAHHNLGNALRIMGRLDEAYDQCRQALRLEPKNQEIKNCLTTVLVRQGRGLEAQVAWRQAFDANPTQAEPWSGYAELCLFVGQQADYRRARRALLDRFGATTDPFLAEPVGRACLLLPGTEDEVRKAVALVDRAVAARGSNPEWIGRYFLFAKGLAEYRLCHLASAIAVMEGEASRVMGPAPRLILAMAQHDQGHKEAARKTLARAILAFDWTVSQADSRDVWIVHILRREAEIKILPNLPAFLRGEYQPSSNDERIALVGVCQFQHLHRAASRVYADALAADPTLAEALAKECKARAAQGDKQPVGRIEELAAECRYPAARSAALAGCGIGADRANLGETERLRLRKQARAWLQADLAMWTNELDRGSRSVRILVKKMLTRWQADPDLAGLREPSALDKLSTDERRECLALWNDVGAVLNRTHFARE
jgi:serine/threonine-protein kinase